MSIVDRIGIKSIKIALAVIISLLIGNLFKFDSPYLTAINAVIGIESTIYVSISGAKERIIGTFIGVLIGIITVTFLPHDFLITTIGIFIIIYACNILKLKSSVVQASVIYFSIMLFPSPNYNAINVTVSTLIGVVVAIGINFILSPFELINSIHKSYYDLRQNILSLCSKIFTTDEEVELQDINSRIMNFKSLVKAYDIEYFKVKDRRLEINQIDILSENLNRISFFIYSIIELRENNLNDDNIKRINKLLNLDLKALNHIESKDDCLLNFHVDKLLDYLETIGNIQVDY